VTETATAHEHWFTSIPCRLGPYGPQDVHYHSCIEGEPGDCYAVFMGRGSTCAGKDSPHERMELTEDGPQPAEALARIRPSVAACEEPPEPADDLTTAIRLLEEALHLRMNGERAPGGNETWRDWHREAERFLRDRGDGAEGRTRR
jgi:hypothetical protein